MSFTLEHPRGNGLRNTTGQDSEYNTSNKRVFDHFYHATKSVLSYIYYNIINMLCVIMYLQCQTVRGGNKYWNWYWGLMNFFRRVIWLMWNLFWIIKMVISVTKAGTFIVIAKYENYFTNNVLKITCPCNDPEKNHVDLA